VIRRIDAHQHFWKHPACSGRSEMVREQPCSCHFELINIHAGWRHRDGPWRTAPRDLLHLDLRRLSRVFQLGGRVYF
jgi:hypothetical protein